MAQILIIDDDLDFGEGLVEALTDLGHKPTHLTTGRQALALLNNVHDLSPFALVFLDLKMPDISGMEVLRAIRQEPDQTVPVVVLTAYADSGNTIEAMKLGAFDHLTKPLGRNALNDILQRAISLPRLQQLPADKPRDDSRLIGSSPGMRQVHKMIGTVASSDATVLILGETGTGKEEVAKALHDHGPRARRPFIAVNCAAIPEELLESELFGHVKGAFTGAASPRAGKFKEAHTGTFFLDEIGDMPLNLQVKILRILETRQVTPVGSSHAQLVDIRIIAATHRDLIASVRDGTFREDLYYRLNVVKIQLPPLRERGSDILILAEHFLQASEPPKVLAPDAVPALLTHSWPGNVRELRNVMQKASLTVPHRVIQRSDLSLDLPAERIASEESALLDLDFHTAIATLEKKLLQRALRQSTGNHSQAAEILKMRRQLFYAKLKQHGLEVGLNAHSQQRHYRTHG